MAQAVLHVRQKYTVRELRLDLPEAGEVRFSIGGPHAVSVGFRHAPETWEDGIVTVTSVVALSDALRDAFVSLQAGRLPPGHPQLDESATTRGIRPDATFNTDLVLRRSDLPEVVSTCVADIARELADALQRTTLTLRWRHAGSGDHRPFSSSFAEWSFDQQQWNVLPTSIHSEAELKDAIRVTPSEVREVEEMVRAGHSEPVGHNLLREAWEQRIRNPRSALIIGVAALEIGTKQCIASLEPATLWMLENLQSPPAIRLLEEYLPRMKCRNDFSGRTLPPPSNILQTLRKAVQQRNRVAHMTGVAEPERDVRESLDAIRDVLWLLDYYQGRSWALGHMRPETRRALTEVAT